VKVLEDSQIILLLGSNPAFLRLLNVNGWCSFEEKGNKTHSPKVFCYGVMCLIGLKVCNTTRFQA